MNKREVMIYSEKRREIKEVHYGEGDAEKAFEGKEVCNARVAYNGKYFLIGIPSHRALGFFSFSRHDFTFKVTKWLTRVSFR